MCALYVQATHIGKDVNSVRKLGGHIGEKAKSLVKKWKKLVPSATPTNHQSRVDGRSDLMQSIPEVTPPPHSTKQPRLMAEEEGSFSRALQLTPVINEQYSKTRQGKSVHGSERHKHKKEKTEKRDHVSHIRTPPNEDHLSTSVEANLNKRSRSPIDEIHSLPHHLEATRSSEEMVVTQNSSQRKRKGI